MFQNKTAILTLIENDPKASALEKRAAIDLIKGRASSCPEEVCKPSQAYVVSFKEAAHLLGLPGKNPVRIVYSMIQSGTIKAFYGGKKAERATGIISSSIEEALKRRRHTQKEVV